MPRPTNRLRVLHAICGESEPRSSAFLAEKTGLPVMEVTRHLRVLRGMGLIRSNLGQKTAKKPMTYFIVYLPSVGGKQSVQN